MTRGFFVTGTDTNVGKTVLSALLVAALDAAYWKPIQTGASEGTDREAVKRWAGIGDDRTVPEAYCFDPPVSPHLAAEWAGKDIELAQIRLPQVEGGRRLVVEGAGGVLVPISDAASMLDLARQLSLPAVIAARSTLGTINHTALTVAALRGAGTTIRGVVMIGPENGDNERAVERFAAVPVAGRIPPLAAIDRGALLHVFDTHFDKSCFS